MEWAESALVEAESISAEEAYNIKVIDIIASNIPNLLEQANGMKISVRGEMQTVNTANLEIQKVEPSWRTRFFKRDYRPQRRLYFIDDRFLWNFF